MADSISWFYSRQGAQAGPVSAEQLRAMVTGRQLLPTDLVWREGMAQWAPLQSIEELRGGGVPPPIPPTQVGYFSPAMNAPSDDIGQNAGMRMLMPVGRSGWAIAAGYLGLFSFVACPAPIALIVSIIAIRDIRLHPDRHGMGRAIFGLVMGILGTIVLVIGGTAAVMNRH
jgi:hypothetical protein